MRGTRHTDTHVYRTFSFFVTMICEPSLLSKIETETDNFFDFEHSVFISMFTFCIYSLPRSLSLFEFFPYEKKNQAVNAIQESQFEKWKLILCRAIKARRGYRQLHEKFKELNIVIPRKKITFNLAVVTFRR